jgi:hypothetical protein
MVLSAGKDREKEEWGEQGDKATPCKEGGDA